MPATTPPPHVVAEIDDNLALWIGKATLMIDHFGRRCLLVDGGRFVRSGFWPRQWRYHDHRTGLALTVTVPTTIDAFEARNAEVGS